MIYKILIFFMIFILVSKANGGTRWRLPAQATFTLCWQEM